MYSGFPSGCALPCHQHRCACRWRQFRGLRNAVLVPALIIGIVCSLISFAGVMLGEQLKDILGNRMEIAGGLILILIGVRVLAEHLFLSRDHVPVLRATIIQGAR